MDVFVASAEERQGIALALHLPAELAVGVMQYVRLFRPAQRALTPRRVAALLAELVPMIQAREVQRNGRAWPAPTEYWRAAFEQMLADRDAGKLRLPLKSHGYLVAVISGFGHRAEGALERKREETRQYAFSSERSGAGGPVSIAKTAQPATVAPMPPETRAFIDQLKGGRDGDA